MVRPIVQMLVALGSLPSEHDDSVTPESIDRYAELIDRITPPITDEEALQLVTLFGDDGFWGVAGMLRHLIETALNWPLWSCLTNLSNPWIRSLRQAALNTGYHPNDQVEFP